MEGSKPETSMVQMAILDVKIIGASVLECIGYMGWAAGSGVGGRYQEDNRLQRLIAERRQLLASEQSEA